MNVIRGQCLKSKKYSRKLLWLVCATWRTVDFFIKERSRWRKFVGSTA